MMKPCESNSEAAPKRDARSIPRFKNVYKQSVYQKQFSELARKCYPVSWIHNKSSCFFLAICKLVRASQKLCSASCTLDLKVCGFNFVHESLSMIGRSSYFWLGSNTVAELLFDIWVPSCSRNVQIFFFTSNANTAKNRTLSRKCEIGRKQKVGCCFFRVAI